MQLDDVDVRRELATRARYLSGAGKKAQDLSSALAQACMHRLGQPCARRVAHIERVRHAGHVDDRAVVQIRRHPAGVERRRHDHEAEVGAREPGLLRERDAQIGVHAALVELIEDDRAEAREQGVLLEPRRQDTLGREEHRGRRTELTLEADVPPDFPADRPPLLGGNAGGEAPRGHASRLEHNHRAVDRQRGRNAGGLPRTGRRRHHHSTGGADSRQDLRNKRIYREWSHRHTRRSLHDRRIGSRVALTRIAQRLTGQNLRTLRILDMIRSVSHGIRVIRVL